MTVERDAAPAGVGKRTSRARAATGLRSQAIGPAARSLADGVSGPSEGKLLPKARPVRRKTPRWRARRRRTFANEGATIGPRMRRLARHPSCLEGREMKREDKPRPGLDKEQG